MSILLSLALCLSAAQQFGSSTSVGASPPLTPHLDVVRAELSGRFLPEYPHFDFENAFFEGDPIEAAVDTIQHPELVGHTVKVWLVLHRSEHEWAANPGLVDLRPAGPDTFTFVAGGIQPNTLTLDNGTILGGNGVDIGLPLDIVLDLDQDGRLSTGDWIDGIDGQGGLFVFQSTALAGPNTAVLETLYSGGTWLGQDLFYPENIAQFGELPLVVVSHGNGHNYTWYDHIGKHLASWGYVVMSHTNNTGPGIEAASTTTLTNTDYLLANLGTIAGGALQGHVDRHRITWIGHSRGGEGVVRAYARILAGTYTPAQFTASDIVLISSIAPTDFLGPVSSNPHDVPYSLWTGGADDDVNGCADCTICQTWHLFERATGNRQSISLHGVGHGAFHNGPGSLVAAGPCQMSRPDTHLIMNAYLLPLVKLYVEGYEPARDCMWRQWEVFKSRGTPTTICAVVDLQYVPLPGPEDFVIDDFQTEPATDTSSSGGGVRGTVLNLVEGRFQDANSDFTDNPADPMNGMTFDSANTGDTSRGCVFEWDGVNRALSFDVVPAARDVRRFKHLSFRACQTTRSPRTTAVLGDLTFDVRLRDSQGGTSTINIGAYGGGIEEPYQRTGCGVGTGWANEFETIRMPIGDFARDGAPLDLSDIVAVDFLFGPAHGDAQGRIGMDSIILQKE